MSIATSPDRITPLTTRRRFPKRGFARAFTLIELMMVLVIIGLLATVAMAFMRVSTDDVRATVYNANRRILQDSVIRYHAEHGAPPSPDRFREQMTMATNKQGDVAAPGTPGYPYGPYLDQIPTNPYTGGSSVGVGLAGDWNIEALTGNPADLAAASRRNITQLYDAAASYMSDHGSFPPALTDLRTAYIPDDTFQVVLISPRTGHAFSYRPADAPQGDAVLIQETGAAADGLLVCYADGRVEQGS